MGKNDFNVLLKCLRFDLQAFLLLLFLRKVEKEIITLQAPNYADKWPILMCHDNEFTMGHMTAVLILKLLGKRSLCVCFMLTPAALIWLWELRLPCGGFSPNLCQVFYSSIIPFHLTFFLWSPHPHKMIFSAVALCWGKGKCMLFALLPCFSLGTSGAKWSGTAYPMRAAGALVMSVPHRWWESLMFRVMMISWYQLSWFKLWSFS